MLGITRVMYDLPARIQSESAASDGVSSARLLHLAEGVLVGLRRIPPEAAVVELVDAARESRLSPFVVAKALVAIAGGAHDGASGDPASIVVQRHWGELLRSPADS